MKKILLTLSIIYVFMCVLNAQTPKDNCNKYWLADVTTFDVNGKVLKTDTIECGNKKIQNTIDWITLTAERFSGMNANWNYNTAANRLYKIQTDIYNKDTIILHYNLYYMH